MPNDIANNMADTIHQLEEELEKAKRLLKAAAKIVKNLPCDDDNCSECVHNYKGYVCSEYEYFEWRYADEALALIGEDTNAPAGADDTNVGHKSGGWISVEDRLPEIGKSVLVIVNINAKVNYLPLCTDLALEIRIGWLDDNGKWGLQFDSADRDEILYWQPLPEPPKDGDTE